jgi:hypothetical protein
MKSKMCNICDDIKKIAFSEELTEEQKELLIAQELDKDAVLDFIDSTEDLGIPIKELGLNEEELMNKDYMWDINLDEHKFSEEKFAVIKLYKYDSDWYGGSNLGPNTRRFCRTLVSRTNLSLMRKEDIDRLNGANPGFGKGGSSNYSIFNWRGGANCRHKWIKYVYDTKSMNLVKAPKTEQPTQRSVGGRVPYANGTNKRTAK